MDPRPTDREKCGRSGFVLRYVAFLVGSLASFHGKEIIGEGDIVGWAHCTGLDVFLLWL